MAFGLGGEVKKSAIFKFWEFDAANWPAINARRTYRDEKTPVKSSIVRFHRLVASLGVVCVVADRVHGVNHTLDGR